jgi:predicted DNA-binding transcriptional regulator AlpA
MQDAYAANENAVPTPVRLSRWVNEPYPPITELLSAHDVARLTRRPRWMIWGLRLIGRFPRKARYRGRRVGWRRSDVLEWMARDLALKRDPRSPASSMPRPRQRDLPLQDCADCAATQRDRQTERSQS